MTTMWIRQDDGSFARESKSVHRRKAAQPAMRTLYWAWAGTSCVGWWETPPPAVVNGRCPRFRAPDIYHTAVVGDENQVLDTFAAAGLVPPRSEFRLTPVPIEWIKAGMKRVAEERAQSRTRRADPEVNGLFRPRDVRRTECS